MAEHFRLYLVQADSTVGDLAGNARAALTAWAAGQAAGADLVVLPELFLSGAPLGDLATNRTFLHEVAQTLEQLAMATAAGPALGIGAPVTDAAGVANGWLILAGGKVVATCRQHQPGPGPFAAAPISGPVALGGLRLGVVIGDDLTTPDVAETLVETGAELLLAPQALAYRRDGHEAAQLPAIARVVETGLPLVWLNAVGGQDDLVLAGGGFVLNPGSVPAVQLPLLEPAAALVSLVRGPDGWRAAPGGLAPLPVAAEADYHAMVLGLRAYCDKGGIPGVLLGLSGGLDSALVAAIAVDALGAERVRCVMLPSEYTSTGSLADATAAAAALGVRLDTIAIDGPRAAVTAALAPLFAGRDPDVTEENIQARLRGLLLMALSNKFGGMVLSTGNKSEMAVGYCTIYGDMAGGFNPLKDLYKTRAFAVSRWRNTTHRPWMKGPAGVVIPEAIIAKPPSAELRPDQKDEDSLPPYPVLDALLGGVIEGGQTAAELVAAGHDPALVTRILRLIAGAEWKRRQSAPGVRLTARPLAGGWNYPLNNRWRDGG